MEGQALLGYGMMASQVGAGLLAAYVAGGQ
jgi:hypothetical protein